MALLPQTQPGLIKTGQMARRQRGLLPTGQNITPEQIGQWAQQNPLDAAALATSPLPVVGDVVGFAADAKTLYDEPSWSNAGWMAAGLLPFVPAGTVKRVVGEAGGVGRKVYRGTSPGETQRISGIAQDALWVSPDKSTAELYGSDIEEMLLKPDAKVLVEGTAEFAKVTGRKRGQLLRTMRKGENLLQAADDAAKAAKAAGYDAVEFNSMKDLGTAIFNEDAVLRQSASLPTDEASRMGGLLNTSGDYYRGSSTADIIPSDDGMMGPGVYVASDPLEAARYADRGEGAGPNIMPLQVTGAIAPRKEWNAVKDEIFDRKGIGGRDLLIATQNELKRRGYVGAERGPDATVIFDKKDVKSRFSKGDW